MEQTPFKKYADLKIQEKRIKAELEQLKPVITAEMSKVGAEKVPSDFGTFTLKPVPVWKYSEAVEKAQEAVDKLKEEEKAKGVAVSETRIDLVFTAPKVPKEND